VNRRAPKQWSLMKRETITFVIDKPLTRSCDFCGSYLSSQVVNELISALLIALAFRASEYAIS